MTADREKIYQAWENFQAMSGGIKRPKTEEEYVALLELLNDLTDRHNCNEEPYSSLFDLVAGYMHEWELENEPELKNPEVAGHEMLAFLMEQQGVSQYQLEKEGVADQGLLSNILHGKRKISKALAKRLSERFKISPAVFL